METCVEDAVKLFPGRTLYAIVLGIGAIDVAWVALSPKFHVDLIALLERLGIIVPLAIALVVASRVRYSSERMRTVFGNANNLVQGLLFAQVTWLALRVLGHVTMAARFPYTDDTLSRWDSYLGLDWLGYFDLLRHSSPLLLHYLSLNYAAFGPALVMSFAMLALSRDQRRARYLLETSLITAFLSIMIGMFFPARGAMAFHVLDQSAIIPEFAKLPGLYFVEAMENVRSDAPMLLDLDELPGLVSFPSFHTAGALIIIACFWRTVLFVPALLFSAGMIAAIPVYGGHYFIDMLAGAAMAVAVLVLFASQPYYRGMFRGAASRGSWVPLPVGRRPAAAGTIEA
jgi:membrane-associated phospholipid phosphatase